ncbi:MAG: HisA/HisF-related TIM barrel protein [Methanocorpusculum sp.]|nr:HisA/HisF-related TIM barrel protein [Methanocorpusculum sp.]
MKIILAVDLKDGYVVHGESGCRDAYRPLVWGLSPSAEPISYLSVMRPRYLYVADLDRIGMCGDHTETILRMASMTHELFADRGTGIPEEYLPAPIHTIVGTESVDAPLEEFEGGFLSVDVKDGRVVPSGEDPVDVLRRADALRFDGCILLNISSVGTGCGVDGAFAAAVRGATRKPLFYGGGVASMDDLVVLRDAGFDGAIVSTAVHKGRIPLSLVQEGEFC